MTFDMGGEFEMQSRLNPYINFDGKTREAMEFYHSVFGGKLDMSTYGDMPMPDMDESEKSKIMHAMLEAENGIVFMAADTPNHMKYDAGNNISLSLSGDNEEELRGYWEKLSDGGNIFQPLEKAPWGDTFGMLTDKFGIQWLVNITGSKE
jgi:PhnB protein